jgi:hypothetical protein
LIYKKDRESLLDLLKENGVSSDDIDSFKDRLGKMEGSGELSDDALSSVAGGGIYSDFKHLITVLL